jgi:hypothetical protein
MAEKSSWAPGKQMAENLVWFGEIERKLAKLSKTTFTYRSSSYLFYGFNEPKKTGARSLRARTRTMYNVQCTYSYV